MLERPLVGNVTRSVEKEKKLTLWPSPLTEGMRLLPLEEGGEFPPAWLATMVVGAQAVVIPRQVLRTKMFSTPLAVLPPRLDAREA